MSCVAESTIPIRVYIHAMYPPTPLSLHPPFAVTNTTGFAIANISNSSTRCQSFSLSLVGCLSFKWKVFILFSFVFPLLLLFGGFGHGESGELMTIVRDVICMTVAHQDAANYSCVVYLSGEAAGQIVRGEFPFEGAGTL